MADDRHIPCRLHCRPVRSTASFDALSEVFARRPSATILGANPSVADAAGFSYWAAEPRETFELTAEQTDPFSILSEAMRKYRLTEEDACSTQTDVPPSAMFHGGWIGYFSYELGRHIERLPGKARDDLSLPLIRLCFYDRFLACDHRSGLFWIVAMELPDDREAPKDKLASLEERLRFAERTRLRELPHACMEDTDLADVRRNMTHRSYLEAVSRIKEYIRDGDVYQVNFSHRLELPFQGDPIRLFHWQSRHNPSGYAAYIDAGGFQIVSASPEMFVTVRDGSIRTKPIKGTRPRIDDSRPGASLLNAERFRELLASEKEQAELHMIIDLERNDVARICKPGTRRVVQPRTIEAYPTVYHAVATIAGDLREDLAFTDILKAMFPGGSITGAPKIRAMEIIDELEPTARGVYTGAIGFVGLDRTASLNIAIRTIIINRRRAFVQAGGGIVADSDPQAEWDESIVKARALLAGIRAVEMECVERDAAGR